MLAAWLLITSCFAQDPTPADSLDLLPTDPSPKEQSEVEPPPEQQIEDLTLQLTSLTLLMNSLALDSAEQSKLRTQLDEAAKKLQAAQEKQAELAALVKKLTGDSKRVADLLTVKAGTQLVTAAGGSVKLSEGINTCKVEIALSDNQLWSFAAIGIQSLALRKAVSNELLLDFSYTDFNPNDRNVTLDSAALCDRLSGLVDNGTTTRLVLSNSNGDPVAVYKLIFTKTPIKPRVGTSTLVNGQLGEDASQFGVSQVVDFGFEWNIPGGTVTSKGDFIFGAALFGGLGFAAPSGAGDGSQPTSTSQFGTIQFPVGAYIRAGKHICVGAGTAFGGEDRPLLVYIGPGGLSHPFFQQ